MIDQRLFIWQLIMLSSIILFPILRRLFAWKVARINRTFPRSLILIILVSLILQFSYYKDYLENTEFQFLQLLFVLLYFNSGFNSTVFEWECQPIKINNFNSSITKKISKALSGSEPEKVPNGIKFEISTPYRLQFNVEGYIDKEKKEGVFFLLSSYRNLRISKAIKLLGLYIIMNSIAENSETVIFPLFGFPISSIFTVLAAVSVGIFMINVEIQAGNSFSVDLPIIYKKLLQQSALDLVGKKSVKDISSVKDKAQAILDKRKGNIIAAKKSELKNRVDSVFGQKTNDGIDPDTIKRIRLMETVKRVLNSTPPWSTVSLSEIAKLSKGTEEEVEIVIAGLRDLKEVSGIYDIWTKMYSGASLSQWFITKMMKDIDQHNTNLENIKIFPDGGTELSLKNKEKKDKS